MPAPGLEMKMAQEMTISVVRDSGSSSEDWASNKQHSLTKVLAEFHEHLAERANHSLGYPVNQACSPYVDLFPFLKFHINNIGDPFKESTFGLHSRNFEIAVLDWFAELWEIGKDKYWGYVTNGGTESNLHALLLGRELFPDGILYASEESHYSIAKAARMFKMDFKKIATLPTGEMDCTDLKSKLLLNKDKPGIINLNIGTTFKGGVDDLDLVLETLEECGFSQDRFYLHCDAALCGLMFPFFKQASTKSICSFKNPIASISVSSYKFLGSPMPSGVLITRKRNIDILSTNIEYIASLDTTISGSRNGHASIFMWYGLSIKGHAVFEQDVEKCLRNARYLRDRLQGAGISSMLNERSITVVFERPPDDVFVRYWQLSCTRNMAHIVVMPHVSTQTLDGFVNDLIEKRKIWYCAGGNGPPCLALDIGASNCACPEHMMDT